MTHSGPAMLSAPATAAVPRWPWPPLVRASVGLHVTAAGAAAFVPGAAPWALAAVVANHALITGAALTPRNGWLGPNVTRLPQAAVARRAFSLTIDDGPDPEVTPQVLDLLASLGLKATFFCIGERARAQPALVRRIVEGGHDVQNHSAHHRHHFSLMGPRAIEREVAEGQAMLADLTGRAPHAFRAPAGLRNPFLDPVLHRLGLHLVSWTRRGFDTREADPQRVLARLTDSLAGGDIVLLHDGHTRRAASGRPVLLEVLPALAEALRAAGLHTETLTESLPPRHP